ncbi:MFS transporter [Actinosynnema sp. CA-248983]
MAGRALQSVGAACMMALTVAFVGEAVPKDRTGRAMGLLGTMSAIGTATGPASGGVLIASPGGPRSSSPSSRSVLSPWSWRTGCCPPRRRASPSARARCCGKWCGIGRWWWG